MHRDVPEHLQILAVPKPLVLNCSMETILHRKIKFSATQVLTPSPDHDFGWMTWPFVLLYTLVV